MAEVGLKTKFITPEGLQARLNPRRIAALQERITSDAGAVNRDLIPVSYYFHSVLWAAQFRGIESRVLRFVGRIPAFWILDFPLILAALGAALTVFRKKRRPSRFLVPVAVMGFTTIVVEMAMLVAFQASYGYVYGKISLLLASFMAGLATGALPALKRKRLRTWELPAVQTGFVVLLLATVAITRGRYHEGLPFAFLFAFGALAGYLFVTANRLFLQEMRSPGAAYGIDLIGSFLGIILASSFVIPLFGIPALLHRLAALNGIGLLFMLTFLIPPRKPC
jgi:spermidine synthase